jgi:sec-independent protein translocase protein TatA
MLPNVGFPELILILAIALLVFGPQRLAGIGGAVGRAMREFRRGLREGEHEAEEPPEPPPPAP